MANGFPGNLSFVRALLLIFSLAPFAEVRAQTGASQAQDRAQLMRAQPTLRDEEEVTGTDDTHAVATPNDPDLGEQAILKRSERYQPFTLVLSAPISYTSNVALARTNEESDVLFTPNVALLFVPRLTKTLYGIFAVSQQFFYYNEFPELDFASYDFRAGLSYTIPRWHNLYLRSEYAFNRLTADELGEDFFSNHGLVFGAEMPFQIGRAQQVSAGVDLNVSLCADPAQPQRHDFSGFVGYSVNLTRSITTNAVARVAVREYVDVDRTDVSGIFALGATCRLTKWFSLSAISTAATNDSSLDAFDYEVFNLGGAVSANLRF